jgi:hypothetical protein
VTWKLITTVEAKGGDRLAGIPLILGPRRATQLSLKFIRWLRHAVRERLAESIAVARLRQLYAVL